MRPHHDLVPQVYLDNHATTPLDPRVLDAMLPYLRDRFGNASSKQHTFGMIAAAAVEKAREHVAALIGARDPNEIVFTSSATEANNLALKGIECTHVASARTEHSSVLEPLRHKRVTWLPVDEAGVVSGVIPDDTDLVCLMLANNEIGTIQSLAFDRKNALLFTDAVQAAGRIPIDVTILGVDALSISAHKLHGPKGAAALWVRRSKPRVPVAAQIEGGGHERGLRAGTLNVPAIVGFGEAAKIAKAQLDAEATRLRTLRDRLFSRIVAGIDGITLNGPPLTRGDRLPHNLNISVGNVDGGALLMGMRDVAVSSGSACASASLEPSHVLRAIGRSDELAHAALRFGLGRFTTEQEIDYAADETIRVVRELRSKRC